MPTPQDRILLQLESDVGRLTLERNELEGELRILKQMLKDAEGELEKETAPRKYVSRDDQAWPNF